MFVVKVGGGQGIDFDSFVQDMVRHKDYVLVHGGSYELNEVSTKLGKPPVFVTSISGFTSRYTDRETLDIFNMIYAGKMNTMFVEKLQQLGTNAVGLTGIDGRLLEGTRKKALKVLEDGKRKILRGDHSGIIEHVNVEFLRLLLDHGYTPVVSPPAISYESEAFNVDGDRCAAQIAVALQVEKLVILSNVPGLLRDPNDESSLIENISLTEIEHHIEVHAKGRMKKKLLAAKEALEGGVHSVILGDGRDISPVSKSLSSYGTVIS